MTLEKTKGQDHTCPFVRFRHLSGRSGRRWFGKRKPSPTPASRRTTPSPPFPHRSRTPLSLRAAAQGPRRFQVSKPRTSVRDQCTCRALPRESKIVHNRVHFDHPRGRESRRKAGVGFLPRGPSAHDIRNNILPLKREQMSRFDHRMTVTSGPCRLAICAGSGLHLRTASTPHLQS
jgi:hypothetical protein